MAAEESHVLFWTVTFWGLFGAFIPLVVKIVLQILSKETELETSLRRQVCDLKAELGGISMVDEFAKYAKIQRKINKVAEELSHKGQVRSSFTLKARLVALVILYVLLAVNLTYLVWTYSSVPVVKLPEEWLFPLGSVLSTPSSVPGGIGILPWLIVTGSVGRLFAKCIS